MSKKNNKKANYISRGKLEHALNIKNNRKDEETKSVQETKKEDVKKESVEANVNNKPANNKKSSKKKYKKGYINSEKLNLDDRVTVEDIIMEETKKDLGEITDKDLVIDNDLEKRRYKAMDAFKYNKVLTTLYTMDCDENDEKVIDNILELVMHCKDKDRKKCVSIVKKFNNSDKSKEELAKTLAQLCAVCKTDIQTIMDKINPPKESLKDKTVVETVENNEEDLKEAVEPTKEELMKDVEMEAKMDIKTRNTKSNRVDDVYSRPISKANRIDDVYGKISNKIIYVRKDDVCSRSMDKDTRKDDVYSRPINRANMRDDIYGRVSNQNKVSRKDDVYSRPMNKANMRDDIYGKTNKYTSTKITVKANSDKPAAQTKSNKDKVNKAYKDTLNQFKINANTKKDFDLLRRMVGNCDDIYDAITKLGVGPTDYESMGIILVSGRMSTIMSLREIKIFESLYKDDPSCKKFINTFVSKCRK